MKKINAIVLSLLISGFWLSIQAQWSFVSRSTPNVEYYAATVAENRAYFWGASNTVLYTDNEGASFTICTPTADLNGFSLGDFKERGISFADSLTGYIADVAHGQFRTTDGGKNWVAASNEGGSAWLVGFADTSVGWKLGYSGLYKTIDAGKTWSFQDIGWNLFTNGYFSDLFVVNKNIVWLTKRSHWNGKGEGVYHTTNGGATWIISTPKIVSDSMHQVSYNRIKINPSGLGIIAGDIIYPAFWRGPTRSLILRTTNNGISWDSISLGPDRLREIVSFGDSVWVIYGNELNSQWDINVDVQYRSTDSGQTWSVTRNIVQSQNYNPFYTCVKLPKDNTIIISTREGFFRSKDMGATYQRLGHGNTFITDIAFDTQPPSSNNQLGIALIAGNKYMITADGGKHWVGDSIGGSSTQLSEVTIYRGDIYIVVNHSLLYRSTDQGKTWTQKNILLSNIQNLTAVSTSALSGMKYNDIIVSRDTGATWKTIAVPSKFRTTNQLMYGSEYNMCWGVFSDSLYEKGFIFQTSDLGNNWRIVDFPQRIVGVKKVSGSALLALSSSQIYRSSDNGRHWTPAITPDDYQTFSQIAMFDSLKGTAWRGYYFWETGDGGISWTKRTTSMQFQESIKKMEYNNRGDLYVVGDKGTLLFYSKEVSPQMPEENTFDTQNPDFSLDNYPNPFNPATTIRYVVPYRSHLTLSIYNTLGQEISRLVDEVKEPGKYESVWNAASLSSGMYFYRLSANGSSLVKKMMLIK